MEFACWDGETNYGRTTVENLIGKIIFLGCLYRRGFQIWCDRFGKNSIKVNIISVFYLNQLLGTLALIDYFASSTSTPSNNTFCDYKNGGPSSKRRKCKFCLLNTTLHLFKRFSFFSYRKGDLAGTNKANKSTTLKVAGVRVQSSSVRVHVQLLIVRLVVVPVVVLAILVGPLLNQQDQQSRSMLQQPNAGFTVRFLSLFCTLFFRSHTYK